MVNDFPPYEYDEDLIAATREDAQTRVRLRRLDDTIVVLGSGTDPLAEVDMDACRAHGVPVLRRRGGGGAVVIDPGNVIVSVTMTGLPFAQHRRQFDALSTWLIAGLEAVGVDGVRQAGISDLAIGDRKISGAALYRSKDLLYYSATLLVAADVDRIERYLRYPTREPDYRAGRRHRDFVTTIATVGGSAAGRTAGPAPAQPAATAEAFIARLRAALPQPSL